MVRAEPLPDTRCVKPALSVAACAQTCRATLRTCAFAVLPPSGEHGDGAKETFEAARRLDVLARQHNSNLAAAARERALVLSRDTRHV